jgi:hypothetical protein
VTDWYTGSPVVLTLDVTPFDGTTEATVAVTTPLGVSLAPTADFVDDRGTWQATLTAAQVPGPGEYVAVWTVTGTGAGTRPYVVPVAPMPTDLGTARVYATTADLARYLGAAPPTGSARRLLAASRCIEDNTRSAIYETDDDGLPTDADVAAALKWATCAQADWWSTTGDEKGDAALWGDVSIGSVRMARTQTLAGTRPANNRLAPQAEEILRVAGLRKRGVGNYSADPWSQ